MYSWPSTSQTRDPFALSTKNGCPPTARNARTGEFTPPGMYFSASAKSSSDFFFDIMPNLQPEKVTVPPCNRVIHVTPQIPPSSPFPPVKLFSHALEIIAAG